MVIAIAPGMWESHFVERHVYDHDSAGVIAKECQIDRHHIRPVGLQKKSQHADMHSAHSPAFGAWCHEQHVEGEPLP